MINQEQAEEIARQRVQTIPGLVKATLVRTRFYDPESESRAFRSASDPDGVMDRESIWPAHWGVVFEVATKNDMFLRRLHVTDEAERRKLVVKFTKIVMVNPRTGKAKFAPTFVSISVCDQSEI